jgi:hypothetical protein
MRATTSFLCCCTLLPMLLACEPVSGPGTDDSEAVCESYANLLCTAACACDGCEMTWPGSPDVFADLPECQTALVEACDLPEETEAQGLSCLSDVIDTVQDPQFCEMTFQTPDSCAPFFEQ